MKQTALIILGSSALVSCESLQAVLQDPAITEAAHAGGAAIVHNAPTNPVDLVGWGYAIGAGIVAGLGTYFAAQKRKRSVN